MIWLLHITERKYKVTHYMLIYGAVLHSSNEPSELSQWPCGHDDSTIHIVMGIIIIIMTSDDLRCVQGLKVTHK